MSPISKQASPKAAFTAPAKGPSICGIGELDGKNVLEL
jgi:hypothetical protein